MTQYTPKQIKLIALVAFHLSEDKEVRIFWGHDKNEDLYHHNVVIYPNSSAQTLCSWMKYVLEEAEIEEINEYDIDLGVYSCKDITLD